MNAGKRAFLNLDLDQTILPPSPHPSPHRGEGTGSRFTPAYRLPAVVRMRRRGHPILLLSRGKTKKFHLL